MWHQVQIGKQRMEGNNKSNIKNKTKKTENIDDKRLKIQDFRLNLTQRLSECKCINWPTSNPDRTVSLSPKPPSRFTHPDPTCQ